ncbi:PREDICTED: la-related protein 6B isoform X2 [Ipomoea nil]|uniref:la-related protein 6B isoform X2 n=1 Tax=Ipomoea nil TaxID=35883 RepID=UPI000900F4F2|nr:PREDICTED: la-related protein 6B isoform X2 [Ipomoea nil]
MAQDELSVSSSALDAAGDSQESVIGALSSTVAPSSSPPPLDLPVESSTSVSPPSDQLPPSLSRNLSLSKLNAGAPAFVPRSATSPSLTSAASGSLPPSPAPPALSPSSSSSALPGLVIPQHNQTLLHVYTTPGGSAFHQIPAHVPVQSHYLYAPQMPAQYMVGGFLDQAGQEVAAAGSGAAIHAVPPQDLDKGLKNGRVSEESSQKILNQVEYYFSDLNLATTDHLMRVMSKDPEGYVPISVVASFKKIKALINSHAHLAKILRNSTKLVVSEDGKKVKRQNPLSETDMEELQSRIIVAENLPEDHCHQNLMKIFSTVGSVKMIRTCQPQTSNGVSSSGTRTAKSDSMLLSNKLHAFVEYETVELAEKAVAELNDAGDWRNLKVRILAKLAHTRGKKFGHDSESNFKEEDAFAPEQQLSLQHTDSQSNGLAGVEESDKDGPRRTRNRGSGRGRGRPTPNNNRGSLGTSSTSNGNRGNHNAPPPNLSVNADQATTAKQPSVPRMPDGTKGFSMGRGKPVAVKTA